MHDIIRLMEFHALSRACYMIRNVVLIRYNTHYEVFCKSANHTKLHNSSQINVSHLHISKVSTCNMALTIYVISRQTIWNLFSSLN